MRFAPVVTVIILFSILTAEVALAGFGVTPPFVRNTSLTRNSVYEQEILLVRATPDAPLQAEVTVDAPEIADWIEIVGGNEFVLPRGEQKVPMTVRVVVPDGVDFKRYEGSIRIKTGAVEETEGRGSVNISLGAQIDIDLTVIDKEILDFRIRRVTLPDLNAGHKLAWLYFPGKIQFKMLLENTGNIDVAPSNVVFRIFDPSGRVLLEETSSLGTITKVQPFATEEVVANIPTRLPPGPYLARYEIFNGDELKQSGELNMNVLESGTLQSASFGFTGLSLPHKISVLLPLFSIALILVLFFYARRNNRKQR